MGVMGYNCFFAFLVFLTFVACERIVSGKVIVYYDSQLPYVINGK
jgi:hypothetical protein